jgi:Glyoxalase/Bleomycin resistance protein/Dioxygenase superfamily
MRVHHVGYVVGDLAQFAAAMPGLTHVRTVEDPRQHARLGLYSVGDGALVELIQPLGSRAYTWGYMSRMGEGLHHVGYDGFDDRVLERLIFKHKMLKVLGPIHAVLFGRPVIFAMTRHRSLVEFLL